MRPRAREGKDSSTPRDKAPRGRTRAAEEPAPSRTEEPAPSRTEEPAEPRLLRTADVLRLTGISHQVLYRYVTLGLIEPARETDSGQRWFRPEVVELIGIIQGLNQSGYSLRDLKDTYFRDKNVRKLRGEA